MWYGASTQHLKGSQMKEGGVGSSVRTQPQFKKLFLLTYKTHSQKQMADA